MRHRILLAFYPLLLISQTAVPPAFEVASVRSSYGRTLAGDSYSSIDTPSPGRLVAENSSLDELIRFAFHMKRYQITGPKWLNDDSECFDVAAKAPPRSSKVEMQAMLQALLSDRFKLQFHRETKVLPVYKLVVGRNGHKLSPAADDGRSQGTSSRGGEVSAHSVAMADFAEWLSREMPHPVLNQTGLEGRFDFSLHYQPGTGDGGPSLSSALQEQLGLRLEPGRAPIEMLVIDRLEKQPTEN